MARKVILDVDPGIDDAMALCTALFDPRLDVVAVTAVGGNCSPEQATRNVQVIIEQLDPPRWPRLGAASAPDDGLPVDGRHLHGIDGLGGATFEVAELQHVHPSEKVICDQIRNAPEDTVTIVALGPLTNIARAFQRDPELPSLVGQIVMMGGAVARPGNITPAAEFNIYCDPRSAQAVFRSHSTKTLIPLDATNKVVLGFDFLNRLPDESTRVGRFLRTIVPSAFRGYRQQFGLEGIHVHDTVTLTSVTNPELFTTGMTVFDRRRVPTWRHNMEVAMDMQVDGVTDAIISGLNQAAGRTA